MTIRNTSQISDEAHRWLVRTGNLPDDLEKQTDADIRRACDEIRAQVDRTKPTPAVETLVVAVRECGIR